MLFGATYLILRLLFDFVITHGYVVARPSMGLTTKIIICLKSLLHIQFFSDWIKQQIRLRKKTVGIEKTSSKVKDISRVDSALCLSAISPEHDSTFVTAKKTPDAQRDNQRTKSTEARQRRTGVRSKKTESRALLRDMQDHIAQNPIAVR